MDGRQDAVHCQHQRVMVPAEKDRLKQEGDNANQGNPAARRARELPVHGFSVAGTPFSIK
jgi:hypothetical protein